MEADIMAKKFNPKNEKMELIDAGLDFISEFECIHARNLDMHCSMRCIDYDRDWEYSYYNEYPL